MAIGLLCIVLAGLGMNIHVGSTTAIIELDVTEAAFTLSHPWTTPDDIHARSIYINNLSEISAPGLPEALNQKSQEPFDFQADGKNQILHKLNFKANTEIELVKNQSKLDFYIKRNNFDASLSLTSSKWQIETEEGITTDSVKAEIPETINLKTRKIGAEPILLRFDGSQKWQVQGLKVKQLRFLTEEIPGSGQFVSTIQSGTVKIPESDFSKKLNMSDILDIKGITESRIEIVDSPKTLKVRIHAKVENLHSGPSDYRQNLMPTFMEYLYHQKKLAFFWSVMGFLWGVLWFVKKTIF